MTRLQKTGYTLSAGLACLASLALLTPVPDSAPGGVPGLDKLVHFAFFFLIALPAVSASPRSWVWIVPLLVVYGGAIEVIQPLFGRGGEFSDFIANTLGVLGAVPVGRRLHRQWLEPRQRRHNHRTKTDHRVPDL